MFSDTSLIHNLLIYSFIHTCSLSSFVLYRSWESWPLLNNFYILVRVLTFVKYFYVLMRNKFLSLKQSRRGNKRAYQKRKEDRKRFEDGMEENSKIELG